jgi:hypothetical protein
MLTASAHACRPGPDTFKRRGDRHDLHELDAARIDAGLCEVIGVPEAMRWFGTDFAEA